MNSQSIEFLSLLGYLYLRSGHNDRALAVLETLVVVDPENECAHRSLAFAYLKGEKYTECLHHLDESKFKGDRGWQLIRNRALWGLGRHDEARRNVAQMAGGLRDFDEQ